MSEIRIPLEHPLKRPIPQPVQFLRVLGFDGAVEERRFGVWFGPCGGGPSKERLHFCCTEHLDLHVSE